MLRAFDIYELWKRGRDTYDIANFLNVREADVYNMLMRARCVGHDITAVPLAEREALFEEAWR